MRKLTGEHSLGTLSEHSFVMRDPTPVHERGEIEDRKTDDEKTHPPTFFGRWRLERATLRCGDGNHALSRDPQLVM
jgi:hypothetical protein